MKCKWIHSAVLCAAVATASTVLAQQRIESDGHALDANNRLGSGGYNSPNDERSGLATGNQIVTGNVVGNKGFRGTINYTDPDTFRGTLSTDRMDRFLRQSSGGDYRRQSTGAPPPVFYGNNVVSSGTAQGPVGQQQLGTGVYNPASVDQQQSNDSRLGAPLSAPTINLPQAGEMMLPGPVDPSNNQSTILSASPLYGIRQLNATDQADLRFINRYTNLRPDAGQKPLLSDVELQKAQDELRAAGVQPMDGGKSQLDGGTSTANSSDLAGGEIKDKALDATVGGPGLQATNDTGTRQRFLVPAEKQSAQLAELKKRMSRSEAEGKLNDAEAARLYSAELQARREADKQGKEEAALPARGPLTPPGTAKPVPEAGGGLSEGPGAGRGAGPVTGRTDDAKPTEKSAPMKIRSLADGVEAKSLHDLLANAETRIREGKFSAALDSYDTAEQIAPNNALILLGRAHAELGASYYGKAEADLRAAIRAEPSLLLAQYDLRQLYGDQRFGFLTSDLKEISQNEQKQSHSRFLLAYLSYNSGNENRAAAYLDEAERIGGADPVIDAMRKNWNLAAGK